MTTGDKEDMLVRLQQCLPQGWFCDFDASPIINAVLSACANALANAYAAILLIRAQVRLKTSSEGWVDLWASDFFGDNLRRRANESDAQYIARIRVNLFRERGTRQSVVDVLTELTGREPIIFEPNRPADTGGYGQVRGLAYGKAGGYGSMLLPHQCFVTAFRPTGSGIPLVAGYGVSTGGYGVPSRAAYGSLRSIQGAVTDADIYAAIDSVKPAGTTVWTAISS